VVVVPERDLREFDFGEIEEEGAEILDLLESHAARSLVIDFHNTDYYGSTALSFFVKLWKRVRLNGGRMAFCNVSPHEREILELTHLNTLWDLCSTQDEAVKQVQG
jgi:anti-anti-sigma factor